MDIYSKLALKIIREQENVIGPLALEQARKVPGLLIGTADEEIRFNGDQKAIIETLVEKYRDFFGDASVIVCKEAVKELISKLPAESVPPILK